MPLRYLRYFLTVAETMNFRKAARELFITQQSLSSQIQNLERHYGVQLFERKPRLRLTPAGENMKEFAQRVLHAEQTLIANLADVTRTSTGQLRVGVTGTRGAVFLPLIWDIYRSSYPNIIVTTTESSTSQLDELLIDGKIDLYIGVNVPRHQSTQVVSLNEDKVYCVFSRQFLNCCPVEHREILLKDPHEFDLSLLSNLPLITFTRGNGLRFVLQGFFEQMDLHPNIIFETNRHDLVLELCRHGHGVGLVYDMILFNPLRQPQTAQELFIVPVKAGQLPTKTTELVYRTESVRPRFHNGFIEATRSAFATYAGQIGRILQNAGDLSAYKKEHE